MTRPLTSKNLTLAWTALGCVAILSMTPADSRAGTDRREPDMSAKAAEVYAQTDGMMRRIQQPGVAVEMLQALTPVVRAEGHPLLVGRLVVAAAAVASADGGHDRVDQLIAAAGAAKTDDIAAFIAGVAAHYRGHVRGASRAAKSADYERAITLLEPLRDRLGTSPRLWIYLAVSYLRTGKQDAAQDAIARAVAADSGSDADVYYCRAEIYHRNDPKRALADIDTYIEIMQRNRTHGAWSAPGKEQLVRKMRHHFAAVAAGSAKAGGIALFDPVRDPASPPPNPLFPIAWWFVGGAAVVVATLWVRRLTR